MLNNKGFAVSSVLYTLLIAFLLFLGAALAQFSSSTSLIGKANDDIVNGTQFEAMQVKPNGACTKDDDGNIISKWYQDDNGNTSNTIVRIKTRYGTKYWPKDFGSVIFDENGIDVNEGTSSGKISVSYDSSTKDLEENYPGYENYGKLTFKDTETNAEVYVILVDVCQ